MMFTTLRSTLLLCWEILFTNFLWSEGKWWSLRLLQRTSLCVTSHSQLPRCCLAMSCLRVFATSRKLTERMAAKSIGHDRRKASSSSPAYTNFKKPRINTSVYRRVGNYGRSNLNFKRHYEYRKPPYQRSQSPTREPPKSSSTTTKQQGICQFQTPILR